MVFGEADIAAALKIKQPSVSKIGKQADMYLSTLRNYVLGKLGELELAVTLPSHPALYIHRLGDLLRGVGTPNTATAPARRKIPVV